MLTTVQKRIIGAGVGVVALLGCFPPWTYTWSADGNHKEEPAGYHFVFAPPQPGVQRVRLGGRTVSSTPGVRVDVVRAVLPMAVVGVVTAALALLIGGSQPRHGERQPDTVAPSATPTPPGTSAPGQPFRAAAAEVVSAGQQVTTTGGNPAPTFTAARSGTATGIMPSDPEAQAHNTNFPLPSVPAAAWITGFLGGLLFLVAKIDIFFEKPPGGPVMFILACCIWGTLFGVPAFVAYRTRNRSALTAVAALFLAVASFDVAVPLYFRFQSAAPSPESGETVSPNQEALPANRGGDTTEDWHSRVREVLSYPWASDPQVPLVKRMNAVVAESVRVGSTPEETRAMADGIMLHLADFYGIDPYQPAIQLTIALHVRQQAVAKWRVEPNSQRVQQHVDAVFGGKVVERSSGPSSALLLESGRKSAPELISPAEPNVYEPGKPEVVRRVFASTVGLELFDAQGKRMPGGSGFVVGDGLIATSLHVVAGAVRGAARSLGGDVEYELLSVKTNYRRNLAILKVASRGMTSPLSLEGSEQVEVTSKVCVVWDTGRSNNGASSNGIINRVWSSPPDRVFETTATVPPEGNGGPVLGASGTVVGVLAAAYRSGERNKFVIPSKYVYELINEDGVEDIPLGSLNLVDPKKTILPSGCQWTP